MGQKNKKDYICKCHKVRKCDMKDKIKEGVIDFKSLQKQIKVGTKCSSCKKKNKKRFYKYVDKYNQEKESPVI